MVTLVRIKPLDKRRGHVLRSYTIRDRSNRSRKFLEERGWYPVEDPALVDYLRTVRQIQTDPLSPLAFDVCAPEEAQAIDRAEEERVVRQSAEDALRVHHVSKPPAQLRAEGPVGDLTTADLRGPTTEAAPVPEVEPARKSSPGRGRRRSRRSG